MHQQIWAEGFSPSGRSGVGSCTTREVLSPRRFWPPASIESAILAVAPDAVNLVSLNFMAGENLFVLDANPNKADLQPPVGSVMKCAPIQSHDPRLSLTPAAPAQGMPHLREDE